MDIKEYEEFTVIDQRGNIYYPEHVVKELHQDYLKEKIARLDVEQQRDELIEVLEEVRGYAKHQSKIHCYCSVEGKCEHCKEVEKIEQVLSKYKESD